MKTNKKGFTLVEIITAIVILGLILAVSVGTYNQITKNVKESEYKNKIKQIELASEKWAEENNVSSPITISINYLIENNYLKADKIKDKENFYYNPITDEDIKCNIVNIEVDSNKVDAKYEEKEDCGLLTAEKESKNIQISAFKYENKKIGEELEVNGDNLLQWSDEDILILVESNEYNNYEKILYSLEGEKTSKNADLLKVNKDQIKKIDTIDETKYSNVLSIKASVFLKSKLNASLYTPNHGTKNKEVIVQIDKESATATVINDNSWKNSNKTIKLQGTDGNGSGLKGFYVYDNANATINQKDLKRTNYEIEVSNLEEKKYYVWTEDIAGNISKEAAITFDVKNIDNTKPTIGNFNVAEKKLKDHSYSQEVIITTKISDSESEIKEVGYCFTGSDNCHNYQKASISTSGNLTIKFPSKKGEYKVCVQAIDNVENEVTKCDTKKYFVDGTEPSTITAKYITSTAETIEVVTTDNESDIKNVTCKYGTTSVMSTTVPATKDGNKYICKIKNPMSNTKYYVQAISTNNSGLEYKSPMFNATPRITVAMAFEEGCENDKYCESSVKLKYGSQTFSLFKKDTGSKTTYWAIADNNYKQAYLINTFCCDQGVCTYANANLGQADNLTGHRNSGYGNFTSALNAFLTTLPSSRTNKLTTTKQYTGYVDASYNDYTNHRSWTSSVGMLNYTDWNNIKNYPYAKNANNTYYALSTVKNVRATLDLNHYTESEQISSVLVNGASKSQQHSIYLANIRPLIVIKPEVVLDRGNGLALTPYEMD